MRNVLRAGSFAFVALGGALAPGCAPVEDSCDLATGEIRVELAAIEESGAATAEAIFRTDDVASIALGDCGDKMTVNGTLLRVVDGAASPLVYAASIEQADEYDFVFSRPDEDDYVSTVSDLRPEVTVTAQSRGRRIECADAWIAATALLHGVPLVTHNRGDYAGVAGLDLISHGE